MCIIYYYFFQSLIHATKIVFPNTLDTLHFQMKCYSKTQYLPFSAKNFALKLIMIFVRNITRSDPAIYNELATWSAVCFKTTAYSYSPVSRQILS